MDLSLLSRRAQPALRWVVVAVSILLLLLFCASAALRVHSPAELEQHEGYMTMSVHHLWHGGALYPRPNFEFLANMYPPVYYYAALAMARLHGAPDLTALRIVSILSTFGCFALIAVLVWIEERRWLPALIAAALYAGSYPFCQGWFDVGRLDSFYVLLVLLAIVCTRRLPIVVAALVWVVAVQTKQPILPVAVIMLAYDYTNIKRTAVGLATFFAGLAASVMLVSHFAGAWYKLYVFKEPAANTGLILRPGVLFWPQNILGPLGLASVIILAACFLTRPSWRSSRTRFYVATAFILLLTWYQMMHNGSSFNVLMPAYAIISVWFGISAGRLQRALAASSETGMVAQTILLAAIAVQLISCIYNPGAYKSTPDAIAAANAIQQRIRSISGDVLVFDHPNISVQAGKPEHPDAIAMTETLRAMPPADAKALRSEIADKVCGGQIRALYFDGLTDLDAFEQTLHLNPVWRQHFSAPALAPGARTNSRPAWEMLAAPTPASGCAAD